VSRVSEQSEWVDVGDHAELVKRRKVVVEHGDHTVFVLLHDGAVRAFENVCIHKQRELSKGVILNGRIICPGHQWAFELESGWEAKMERCQPTFDVEITDGRVLVDLASAPERAARAHALHPSDPVEASAAAPATEL
jgi:nitrite reductase (NADH) small subunit